MNKVFIKNTNVEMTPEMLAAAANAISGAKPFTKEMFEGPDSRIQGAGHGYCNNDCEFELLPIYDEAVREGQKRYMVCRKCGAVSHL